MRELYSLWEDFREDYRHNPSFGSIILEDLYTSSGRIIILPIGRYLHILTFLSLPVTVVAIEKEYITVIGTSNSANVTCLITVSASLDIWHVHLGCHKWLPETRWPYRPAELGSAIGLAPQSLGLLCCL